MHNRAEFIGMMLAAFPRSGTQGELAARAYLMAVEGISDYAIARSASEFIKGHVPGHDTRFAPSAAAFAAQGRVHDDAIKATVSMIERAPSRKAELLSGPYFADGGADEVEMHLLALGRPAGLKVITGGRDEG